MIQENEIPEIINQTILTEILNETYFPIKNEPHNSNKNGKIVTILNNFLLILNNLNYSKISANSHKIYETLGKIEDSAYKADSEENNYLVGRHIEDFLEETHLLCELLGISEDNIFGIEKEHEVNIQGLSNFSLKLPTEDNSI